MKLYRRFAPGVTEALRRGGIGVIPTDTVYGVVGSAFSKRVIRRIYRIRKRNPKKPMVVLIGSGRDLKRFGVRGDRVTADVAKRLWPGPVSIVFQCASRKFSYLHRGTESIAFRLPNRRKLRRLLAKTGPLVAPSANPEGDPPAETTDEARNYFGDSVDFYVDGGKIARKPSRLVQIRNGNTVVLRS